LSLNWIDCRAVADGITVKVKVQPRSSRNGLVGFVGDSLKLALTSPPVDGAANEACIRFFANFCGVPKNQVEIISGQKSREKVIRILGVDKAGFFGLLEFMAKID